MKTKLAMFTSLLCLTNAFSATAKDLPPEDLNRRHIERRAVEAAIWGMPAVNYERMLQAALANGAKANQVVYWSRPVNWKNQTLTPNPDTIYLNPFYDTTAGPVHRQARSQTGYPLIQSAASSCCFDFMDPERNSSTNVEAAGCRGNQMTQGDEE